MEISTENLDNIQLAGDSAHISDKLFTIFVERVCDSILVPEKKDAVKVEPKLKDIDGGVLKQSYAGIATLLLEAAKHDQDEDSVGVFLEDCKYTPDRIKSFTKIYKDKKPSLRILLSSTGTNPPHVVDVDWRLDYYMKNNHLDKVSQPVYLVSLKSEECGEAATSNTEFSCTQDQLEDLVGKLKDACKSMERASQM